MAQSNRFERQVFVQKDALTAITATPQNSGAIHVSGANRLRLLVDFTFVAGTAFILTFDVSPDATTWYELTSVDISAGTGTRVKYTDSTATGSASKKFEVRLADIDAHYIRYNYSATAGTTDSATVLVYRGYSD